jgi:hypothetical protein
MPSYASGSRDWATTGQEEDWGGEDASLLSNPASYHGQSIELSDLPRSGNGSLAATQDTNDASSRPFPQVPQMQAKIPAEQGDQQRDGQGDGLLQSCCEKCGNALDNDCCNCCTPIMWASTGALTWAAYQLLTSGGDASKGKQA